MDTDEDKISVVEVHSQSDKDTAIADETVAIVIDDDIDEEDDHEILQPKYVHFGGWERERGRERAGL